MLSRRAFVAGLLAMPAVVHAGNLMSIKGVKYDPIVRLQSWPYGTDPSGEYWTHEGPLSRALLVEREMRAEMGNCYRKDIDTPEAGPHLPWRGNTLCGGFEYKENKVDASRIGYTMTVEERISHRRHDLHWSYNKDCIYIREPLRYALPSSEFNAKTIAMKEELARICKWGS